MIEKQITRSEFNDSPKCPHCDALLQRNPYDYGQKYCPSGCGYSVRRDAGLSASAIGEKTVMVKFRMTEGAKHNFEVECARRNTTMSQVLREFAVWYVNGGELSKPAPERESAQTKEKPL